jgi:hypothetical protein
MWTIACVVGPASFALLFKTEENAAKAIKICNAGIKGELAQITDDFGQQLVTYQLQGYLAEDLEQSKLARVEFALHQQRTQLLAQKAAENDTVIRTSRMMQGPAVLDPGFGMPIAGRR